MSNRNMAEDQAPELEERTEEIERRKHLKDVNGQADEDAVRTEAIEEAKKKQGGAL